MLVNENALLRGVVVVVVVVCVLKGGGGDVREGEYRVH